MRSGKILNKKFFQFLLPTVLSTVAISLNEFVDCIMVSNLLGQHAMALVNMGTPVMLVFAVIYSMFGTGGAVVFASLSGAHEEKRAGKVYTVTFITASALAVIISLFGMLFDDELVSLICKAEEYRAEFTSYYHALLISGLLIIPLQVIIISMPSLGTPGIGTAINITANVVNIGFDYIYIRFFHTGLEGAAYATLTGYAAGVLIVIVSVLLKKLKLPFARVSPKDLRSLGRTITTGLPTSFVQVGYCIKIFFINGLSFRIGEMVGLTAFTVCIQAVSIVSIFQGGITDATVPIIASVYGQKDYSGIRIIMKTAARVQFAVNLAIVLIFELYPEIMLRLYHVEDGTKEAVITGLRIFSIMFLFRPFYCLFMNYFSIIGRKLYGLIISLTDGFIGIIPLTILLSSFHGLIGIWEAFVLLSVLILISVLTVNYMISKRSNGKYSRILLLEHEPSDIPVFDSTVRMNDEDISGLASKVQEFCLNAGLGDKLSVRTALSAEEMSVYTMSQKEQTMIDCLDILIKVYPEDILIDVRSIGKPLDTAGAKGDFSNLSVLRSAVSSMTYDYVLGMNQTRLKVKRDT